MTRLRYYWDRSDLPINVAKITQEVVSSNVRSSRATFARGIQWLNPLELVEKETSTSTFPFVSCYQTSCALQSSFLVAAMDAQQDTEKNLPRAVTIDVSAGQTTHRTGSGFPRSLSRQSTTAASTRIPVEYRTLSQHVHDRDDLRVGSDKKDKDKRRAIKG